MKKIYALVWLCFTHIYTQLSVIAKIKKEGVTIFQKKRAHKFHIIFGVSVGCDLVLPCSGSKCRITGQVDRL